MSDPRYTDQRYPDPRYSNLWNHNLTLGGERTESGWVLGFSVLALTAIVFTASIYFKPESNSAGKNLAPVTDGIPPSENVYRPDSASTQSVDTLPRR